MYNDAVRKYVLLVMDLLKPLLKIEDVIKILEYIKIVPQGVPDRYEHIRNVFNLNIKEQNSNELSSADVARLVQTLESLLPRFDDNRRILIVIQRKKICKTIFQRGSLKLER